MALFGEEGAGTGGNFHGISMLKKKCRQGSEPHLLLRHWLHFQSYLRERAGEDCVGSGAIHITS